MILQSVAIGLSLMTSGAQAWDLISENEEGWKTYRSGSLIWTAPTSEYLDLAEAERFCSGKLDVGSLLNVTAGSSANTSFRLPTVQESVTAIQGGLTEVLPYDYDPRFWAAKQDSSSVIMDGEPRGVLSAYAGSKVRVPVRCVAEVANATSADRL